MDDQHTTHFGGVTARVLWGALSVRSLATGIVIGVGVAVCDWMLFFAGTPAATTPLNHAIGGLVLARYALNGQFGEWQGSIASGSGGNWVEVYNVALRILTLSFVWLLPMMLVGLSPELALVSPGEQGALLFGLYVTLSLLSPPLILIVAVTAESFGDLFSPRHWKGLFAGRMSDLVALYATYAGGLALVAVLCVPPVLLAFAADRQVGILAAGLGACLVLGVSLDVLGRLCGFFALGDFAAADAVATGPGLTLHPATAAGETFWGERPPPGTAPAAGSPPRVPSTTRTSVEISVPATEPGYGRKPLLMDSKEQVDRIVSRFERDPAGAIETLERLHETYATNAQVLAGLCICRHRNGEKNEALRLAREALPLALERGHSYIAVDLFKELRAEVGRLHLDLEQTLVIAGAAAARGDLSTAGEAYSLILCKDSDELRAIEGLVDVAGRILREKNSPAVSLKVYRFLEDRCAGSPLAAQISSGIAAAERRLS